MKLDFDTNLSLPTVSVSDDTNEVSQMLQAGIQAAQQGNRVEAKTLLLEVTELEPENENAWLWLASISEYPEELLVFLNNVLSVNPNNERAIQWAQATNSLLSKTFVERGTGAARDQRKDFARQCFLQATVHEEKNETAWLKLSSLSETVEEKTAYLNKVLSFAPENKTALSTLESIKKQAVMARFPQAIAEAFAGENQTALETLEAILAETPETEEAWLLKSYLVPTINEKIICFDKVLEINPDNELARANDNFLQLLTAKLTEPQKSFEEFEEDEEIYQVTDFEITQSKGCKMPNEKHNVAAESPDESDESETQRFIEFEDQEKLLDATYFAEIITEDEPEEEPTQTIDFEENLEQEAEKVYEPETIADFQGAEEFEKLEFEELEEEEFEEENFDAPTDENNQQSEETAIDSLIKEVEAALGDFEMQNETSFEQNDALIFSNPTQENNIAAEENEEIFEMPELFSSPADNNSEEANAYAINFDDNETPSGETALPSYYEIDEEVLSLSTSDEINSVFSSDENEVKTLEFSVPEELPVDQSSGSEEVEADKNQDSPVRNKTILVVDDSATVRKLIAGKLEKSGHEVFCAVDGVDALEKIEEIMPDLILLDINMPRMDGYEACKLIRSNDKTKDVPVVMISGKDGFFDKVRGRMAGTTGYITKPFGPETLMKTVENYIV